MTNAGGRTADQVPLPGGNFSLFVQRLGYQALLGLGVLDNPLTQTRSVNLQQARMVIDDLAMLRDRTRGNLDASEEEHLTNVLADLEAHFERLSEDDPS